MEDLLVLLTVTILYRMLYDGKRLEVVMTNKLYKKMFLFLD